MIGDVLTSTIIAQQLKISFPQAQVDYLVSNSALAVVDNNPYIDKVVSVQDDEFNKVIGRISLSRKLNIHQYTAVIDVYGKLSSAHLCWLIKAQQKIGYNKWFSRIAYTHAIDNKPDRNIYKQGLSLGSRMLLTNPIIETPRHDLLPKIHLNNTEKKQASDWLIQQGVDLKKPIIMIGILGSSPEKSLPSKHMAQVVNDIVDYGNSQLLFNYIPSQREQAIDIYQKMNKIAQQHTFIDAITPSLRSMLAVMSFCKAVIGNEGGIINMAKALDIPSFAIYSPWINKTSWNIAEDGSTHTSVHLKELRPDLYGNKKASAFKKQATALYQHLQPELFHEELVSFLKHHF